MQRRIRQARRAAIDTVAASGQSRAGEADDLTDLADEAYAVRVLDALHGGHPTAVRHHDGVHLIPPTPSADRRPTRRVPLSDKPIRIGRTPDNDLVLADLDVSATMPNCGSPPQEPMRSSTSAATMAPS